jgi:hypothetical protein
MRPRVGEKLAKHGNAVSRKLALQGCALPLFLTFSCRSPLWLSGFAHSGAFQCFGAHWHVRLCRGYTIMRSQPQTPEAAGTDDRKVQRLARTTVGDKFVIGYGIEGVPQPAASSVKAGAIIFCGINFRGGSEARVCRGQGCAACSLCRRADVRRRGGL